MAPAYPRPGEAGEGPRDAAGHGAPHTLLQSHYRDGEQVSLYTKIFTVVLKHVCTDIVY